MLKSLIKASQLFIAVALIVTPLGAQSPAVPIGPAQIITPPLIAPRPAVVKEPTADDLKKPFAIVVTIGHIVITEPVVEVPVGKLLIITLEGDCMTPAEEGGPAPLVSWSMSQESTDVDNYPPLSDHLTVTSQIDTTTLFMAAVNNPNGAPFVTQRWIKFGKGPRPPPVDPIDPVDPVKPPVVVDPIKPIPGTGIRALILRDEKTEGVLPASQRQALQATTLEDWLSATCAKDADNIPMYRKWDGILTADQITESEDWKTAFAMAKERSKGVRPWIEGSDGTKTISQALPLTEAEIKTLLKKQ